MGGDFTILEAKAFDLLTVIVMLEQCEQELTMVQFVAAVEDRRSGMQVLSPIKVSCMQCLLRRFLSLSGDPRSALMAAVKAGTLQILSIYPRSEVAPCKTCPPLKRF